MNPSVVEPSPPSAAIDPTPPVVPAARPGGGAPWWLLAFTLALGAGSLWMAWQTNQRVQSLEQELVRRQQDSATLATEARVLARQAQDASRDAVAKVALLESRVAENTVQRAQLDELLQAMTRSRDENMLADIEAGLRVAVQQSAITGSTEPLIATLKQADERLARNAQPRLERVRRAVAHDLDRVRAVAVSDISTLVIKVDEAMRMVDELPLLVQPDRRGAAGDKVARAPAVPAAASAAAAAAGGWRAELAERWNLVVQRVLDEARSLVRVTRIDEPEAMLVAPEQAYFLRENMKLRLLNARLALLSRQFTTAQSDLRDVQLALERHFDRGSRRVNMMNELLRQVGSQSRGIVVPRPDETFAALTAVMAGR
ncbi:MAG TPA: uroporphyrinogen-III C-methyltransferase [Burkholderiaceae bacterium]|nr:uroporphyrinogen-III C-methyltransferase [Burkholderiaceae bacterium]